MEKQFDPVTQQDIEDRKNFDNLSFVDKRVEIDRLHERGARESVPSFYEKLEHEQNGRQRELLRSSTEVAEAIDQAGGLALVVGGYARDEALRKFGQETESKDIDLEVYGLSVEQLTSLLQRFGELNVVGASFGVIKLGELDISIPRRDSKTGQGHRGFSVEGDPSMLIMEAARRRDFTVNAIALNPLTGELIDHFGGLDDIQHKILRATDFELFKDDPLRVLRAMQFAGRFEFSIEEKTEELCRSIDLHELSKERIGEEWEKLLLKSVRPSLGLEVADSLGILKKLHPELHQLIGVLQDPEWHPEGDVWTHTKLVVDSAAEIVQRENLDGNTAYVVILAALCHDLGKPKMTEVADNGKIVSKGHSESGIEPTKKFLWTINASQDVIRHVVPLVQEHLFPSLNQDPSLAAIRRLAYRLYPASIQELVFVAEADQRGRGILIESFPTINKILELAEELSIKMSKPSPIFMGRHLIEMGMMPGKDFSRILTKIFEAQLDGKVSTLDEAKLIARELI